MDSTRVPGPGWGWGSRSRDPPGVGEGLVTGSTPGGCGCARVSHESGCFILLTKTDHRPFQATMKTAARQKRRRASVSICKQNKTRDDERAEGAALGRGALLRTLLTVGICAMGKAATPTRDPGPCVSPQPQRGSRARMLGTFRAWMLGCLTFWGPNEVPQCQEQPKCRGVHAKLLLVSLSVPSCDRKAVLHP